MDIPYDLIHKLEDEYGSISNVSENNAILKSIRLKLHIKHAKRTNFTYNDFKEEKIIEYLKKGYSIYETAQLTQSSYAKVRKIKSNYKLKTLPRFKYVAIGNEFKVYSLGLSKFKIMSLSCCSNFANTQKALRAMGYELKEAKGYFHWCNLKKDDHYIIDRNIYTKQ